MVNGNNHIGSKGKRKEEKFGHEENGAKGAEAKWGSSRVQSTRINSNERKKANSDKTSVHRDK